jgi:hypothetical protein
MAKGKEESEVLCVVCESVGLSSSAARPLLCSALHALSLSCSLALPSSLASSQTQSILTNNQIIHRPAELEDFLITMTILCHCLKCLYPTII